MRNILLGLCCLLGGCMLGPNYHPPDNCIPDAWSSDFCCSSDMVVAWWDTFHDPLLNHYIERAACYNNDILTAEATIFQARALRQITASQLFPQLNADLSFSRTYFSKNGPVFALGPDTIDTPGLPFQLQIPQMQNIYTALIDASWEIDLFGKIRRAVESADANIGSAVEQKNGVLLSVIAEVARNYIDLRSAQQKGVLVEENISLLEHEHVLIQQRWEKGLDNRLNVENIEAQLAELKATLPPISTEIFQCIYAISTLTGALPEALLEELLPIAALPETPPDIVCGLRSDVLRRRPDVREAERNLASATANIGVAVASFFPSLSLLGDFGVQSVLFRRLFQANSNTWSIGAASTIPIFQGGNLVGNLRLSEGEAAAAGFAYQQTVLRALEEAEGTLVSYTQEVKAAAEHKQAVDHYSTLDSLNQCRYDKGLVGLSDVLDSSRRLNLARQNLLESETNVLIDIIALYKALGGGWEMYSIH